MEPVAGRVRAQVRVERGDEARRQVVLGGAHGDARHERRHRLVADVLVDEVGRLPELVDVDPGVHAQPRERGGERLAGDAVQRERERVERARDQVGAGAGGLERVGEPRAGRALAVEADGQAGRLGARGRRARPPGAARGRRSGRGSARASRRARRARATARRACPSGRCRPGCRRGRRGTPCPRRRSPRPPRAGSRRRSAGRGAGRRRSRSRPPRR